MATSDVSVSAAVRVAQDLIKRAVSLTASITASNAAIDANKAAISAMLQGLGVTHRWVGTRLDLLGPDGEYVAGPDLKGPTGDGAHDPEFRFAGGYLQYRLVGDEDWTDLIDQADVTGPQGPGIEFRVTSDHIQTRWVGDEDWTDLIALADLTGDQGPQGVTGDEGPQGDAGWSPILSLVEDDERRVLLVSDWTGGAGTKPDTGSYVGASGLVSDIADAIDIRGAAGANATGDMSAAVYDTNADGRVDEAEAAPWDGITDKPSTFAPSAHVHPISEVTGLQTALDGKAALAHTHAAADIVSGELDPDRIPDLAISKITDLQDGLDAKQDVSEKGQANGYAGLDGAGKLPTSVIPEALLGVVTFQGVWDADANDPAIPSADSDNKGHYYVVGTAGATEIDGESGWSIGDWIISDGSAWSKVDNTDQVVSVAGLQGVISRTDLKGALELVKGDVGLGNVDNTADADKPISDAAQTALDAKANVADISQVGFTGSYDDLIDSPSLASVAVSGSYTDLVDVPSEFAPEAHQHDANDIDSGVLDAARIPDLDAAKIATGSLDAARIPDLDAAKIATGSLDAARVPTLDAAKIGTGSFDTARIPSLAISKITSLQTNLDAKQDVSAKGSANGYAGLDGSGKVPTTQLPASVLGTVAYQGGWNATTDSPTIPTADSTNKGNYYLVTTAGATEIDGESDWQPGDWIISDGSAWSKVDNTDRVASVAGKTGTVTLEIGDVADLQDALDAKSDADHVHDDATESVAGFMSAADKTKLDGVATGATANQTDSYLLSRTNHTGTQAISTVTGLQTALDGKEAADADILKSDTDKTLTAGYAGTAVSDGTKSSGTYTPTYAGGNLRRIVNGGAFTLAAPSASGDYTLIIQITNNSSAGAVTLSGFNKTSGDSFTTTNGDDFFVFITKINGFIHAMVQALQ